MKYPILFVSLMALSCGGQQKPAAKTPPPAEPAQATQPVPPVQRTQQPDPGTGPAKVTVRVETIPKGQTQPREVQPGDVMHSGDRFAMNLKVDRAAYVYVLYAYGGSKPADQLFPERGDRLLQPGSEARVPGPSDWVLLDQDTGEENLFIITAKAPLSIDDLRKRVDDERTDQPDKKKRAGGGKGGKGGKAKPEGGGLGQLSASTRGGKVMRTGAGAGGGAGDDETVFKFTFKHQR